MSVNCELSTDGGVSARQKANMFTVQDHFSGSDLQCNHKQSSEFILEENPLVMSKGKSNIVLSKFENILKTPVFFFL